jgi:2,4-dienoyl-CoA reductase (NADPH2)
VEIIGSAGYLLSTFLVQKTNLRTDRWGGSVGEPHALRRGGGAPGARRGGDRIHPDLPHLRDGHARRRAGLGRDRVAGAAVEAAGANIISTHFCWHEAPVPTIATMVPRAAFTSVTGRLRQELTVPVITSNRINMPEVAESCWRAAMPTWCRWRGRCWPTPNW